MLIGITVAVVVLVLVGVLVAAHSCRRLPRVNASDKLRASRGHHGGVLTYSNPNYVSDSAGGSSAGGSTTSAGGGYRGWIRRLKYDRSAVSSTTFQL